MSFLRPDDKPHSPLWVIAGAVALVALLSMVPWTSLTGGFFKDFSLVEDISRHKVDRSQEASNDNVDPLLTEALQGKEATETTDAVPEIEEATPPIHRDADGNVLIEDYTPGRVGFIHLARALETTGRARVAMIGDSYIEGDVLCQDVRQGLQEAWGGQGVGYMGLQTDIPGFRQSVRQSGGEGWIHHDIRHSRDTLTRWLAGQCFVGIPGATATYRGSSRPGRTKNWDRSTLIFMCPDQGGNLQISNGSETRQVYVEPSSQLHALTLMGNTSQFTVTNVDIPHLEAVGVWLESSSGVTVDNMSLRGNSGVSHRRLSRAVTQQLADEGGVDYDLVIVEYGTNAVSAGQTNYDGYGRLMADVIGKIKASYPNADILMMAIGDRGQRVGSEVRSLQAVGPMIDVQRATARRSGVAFWDTREAMGGVDAVVDWNRQGFINADFVHLSHRGGARLAPMLVHAIILNTPLPER